VGKAGAIQNNLIAWSEYAQALRLAFVKMAAPGITSRDCDKILDVVVNMSVQTQFLVHAFLTAACLGGVLNHHSQQS
jgi:hypothetical protein